MMVLIPYLEAIDHETVSSAIHFVNTGFIIVTKSNLSTYTSQVVPVCNQIIKYITTDVMRKAS